MEIRYYPISDIGHRAYPIHESKETQISRVSTPEEVEVSFL